jgi:hypothetical protein
MGKVFGIGLSRTGSLSLNEALCLLGYSSIHFPEDLSIVDSVSAATDTSVTIHLAELDRKYPGSKFIQTVRDVESWLKSMKWLAATGWLCGTYTYESLHPMVRKTCDVLYGTHVFDERKMRDGYYRHLKATKLYFRERPKDLLVMNICAGDGWEKLCPFLGEPIPAVPFPKRNETR